TDWVKRRLSVHRRIGAKRSRQQSDQKFNLACHRFVSTIDLMVSASSWAIASLQRVSTLRFDITTERRHVGVGLTNGRAQSSPVSIPWLTAKLGRTDT